MTEIMTLTDDQRKALLWLMTERLSVTEAALVGSAIRTIDAQAKRIAELEGKLDEVWDRWEMAQVDPRCRDLALEEIGDLLRIKPSEG